jgi:CubicO group peptidase (beta-lactamase class C family)
MRLGLPLLLVVGMAWPAALIADEPDLKAIVTEAAEPVVGEKLVGLSVALVWRDRQETFHFGRVHVDRDARPTDETVYEIGSLTKPMTGILLAEAAARGELKLDDPVAKFFAKPVLVPSEGRRPIQLVDIVTHRSGLPRLPPLTFADPENPYKDFSADDLVAYLQRFSPQEAPDQEYRYSNLGFGILGQVLERATGKSYGALIDERLFTPLGMKQSAVGTRAGQEPNVAQPHTGARQPTPPWDIPALAAAGAVRSSTADMVRYLAAHVSPPDNELGQAIRTSMTPIRRVDDGVEMGLAWHIVKANRAVTHSGQTGGSTTIIFIRPQQKRGMLLMTNTSNLEDLNRVAVEIEGKLNAIR